MQVRTSKPEAGNKFYNTKAKDGYNTCIQGKVGSTGKPDSDCDVLSNCVGYASGRFNEIIGEYKYTKLNCNAENFIERAQEAGLQISQAPTVGGIIVWQKGTLSSSDGAGHVAIVEKIIDSNTIYTSESGYNSPAFWNSTRTNNNGKWGIGAGYTYRGCIVNPAVKEETPVSEPVQSTLSIEEIAKEVIAGKWGNQGDNPSRQSRLEAAGYNYSEVQSKVNEMLLGTSSTSNKKSNQEIAKEVIAGKWDKGQARKDKLAAAGYDYSAVQAIVNEMLLK